MTSQQSRTFFVLLAGYCLIGGRPARAQGTDPAVLESGYRRVVELWASGDAARAVDELVRFESAAISDQDPGTRERLHKAEQRVISEVAGADLESLVPLSLLHQEGYRYYAEHGGKGAAQVATHDRSLAQDLALLYRQHVGTEAAAELASHLVTRLASLVTDSLQAARLFELAKEFDPRNAPASLGLATVFEKNGNYVDAADALRRVLELEPKNPEGRLRLALCLSRMDKTSEARKLLTDLVAAPAVAWIGLLATEELARLELDDQKPERAEKVLRAGLGRYPTSARLVVELAAALDGKGAFQEARSVLERLPEIAAEPQEDSRYRYNRLSEELFAEADQAVAAAGRDRLPVLARSLVPPPAPAQEGVAK
ncbi:MAG TPA: tetratricopeptide repeat protein [Thermoanaerobaculia bacterium]|nr:tetratricopeptide repeat protein [Thermoanaerobaculia bacterium]